MSTGPEMQKERKLFGTDGIRGVAGAFPLDTETVFAIGRALGHHLGEKTRVIIGQDTRESSRWIADEIAAGLISTGAEVHSAGVITTPGVAYLARLQKFSAGVVISASHNPWTDNGIKVFGGDGYKLADSVELAVEHEIFKLLSDTDRSSDIEPNDSPKSMMPGEAALRRSYVQWVISNVDPSKFKGLNVEVDCANGAASELAHQVFQTCGLEAHYIEDSPDGQNINEGCGALHPEVVANAALAARADLGITFDGDADRALFACSKGKVINGDAVLLLVARDMKARGVLKGDLVVATTMSNMGLEAALKRSGIRMLRAPVGDKYVLEEMQRTGATLGGEQSGHIIFRDGDATTGDGLLTALRVMEIVGRAGKPLAELVADLKVFPQTIKNVRVREKKPLMDIGTVADVIRAAEKDLDGNGRVVVRYSGTEALARVMIEAESADLMHKHADAIAGAIQKVLGV
jgi:phosphoglucosamine mutase